MTLKWKNNTLISKRDDKICKWMHAILREGEFVLYILVRTQEQKYDLSPNIPGLTQGDRQWDT